MTTESTFTSTLPLRSFRRAHAASAARSPVRGDGPGLCPRPRPGRGGALAHRPGALPGRLAGRPAGLVDRRRGRGPALAHRAVGGRGHQPPPAAGRAAGRHRGGGPIRGHARPAARAPGRHPGHPGRARQRPGGPHRGRRLIRRRRHTRSAPAANTRMLVVRARRAGASAGSGHNSTVRPRPPKTTSPPLVARPAGGTTSGPIASPAREQESWLGAVRTAVDQAHLRSDAVAGLNTLADSLASYADWHGPAVARPPWAVLMASAGRSRSWVGRRLAWLREHGLLVIAEHGLANRPAAYLLTIPTASRRQHGGWDVGQTGV